LHSVFSSEYRSLSRTPALSFLFVAPIWCLYEILTFSLNNGSAGHLRTGVDFLIRETLNAFHLPAWSFAALAACALALVLYKKKVLFCKKHAPCFLFICFWKV